MSRREQERNFRQELILRAAARLLEERSADAVTMEDIAREAEIGKGTLYQYFSSKDDLLAHLLCRQLEETARQVQERCLGQGDGSTTVKELVALHYRLYRRHARVFLDLLRRQLDGTLEPGVFNRLRDSHRHYASVATAVLAQPAVQECLVDRNPARMTRVLTNIVKGFVIGELESNETEPPADNLALLQRVVEGGIIVREKRG
ncbi:MAG: helix-turn-helix domain-containing protein [Syntrophomonadaceae bacterium]|nr:helix-turn-helix domain-containing protein [Syntrophomonadaceae bacterium]